MNLIILNKMKLQKLNKIEITKLIIGIGLCIVSFSAFVEQKIEINIESSGGAFSFSINIREQIQ